MLVIDKYKVAFLHINKAAGTSIQDFLIDLAGRENVRYIGPAHGTLLSKMRYMGQRINEYTILTSIRNPYARLISIYLFRRKRYKDGEKDSPIAKQAYDLSFKEWFKQVIMNSTRWTDLSMTESMMLQGSVPDNVYPVCVESLNKDMTKFCKDVLKLNLGDIKMPHSNKTAIPRDHHTRYYDKEHGGLVYVWDKWVIDNYYPWTIENYF